MRTDTHWQTDGQKDISDEANSCFSRLRTCAYKYHVLPAQYIYVILLALWDKQPLFPRTVSSDRSV